MIYLLQFLAGNLGILGQCLYKISKIEKRTAPQASWNYVFVEFFKTDLITVLMCEVFIAICMMFVNPYLGIKSDADIKFVNLSYQETVRVFMYPVMVILGLVSQQGFLALRSKTESAVNESFPNKKK